VATGPLWLGLTVPAELFGLDGALDSRAMVEVFSAICEI